MKPLLVATNFSQSSVNAARYAADMALEMHTDLHLLYVMQIPVSNAEIPMTEGIFNEMKQSSEEGLQNLKIDLEKQTKGKINISVLLETGSVEDQIEEFCKRLNPFAVVMGIKKGSIERYLFGSNTLFAAKHLCYPLLVIPEGTRFHTIRNILLTCNLTDSNETMPVEYLKELQRIFHSVLKVLSVNTKKIEQLESNKEFSSLSNLLHDLYPTYYFTRATQKK